MINYIKRNKDYLILITLLLIGTLIMFFPFWIKGDYFIGGGDVKTQWYEFYTLIRREIIKGIKNKSFPFYSWSMFLGGDIWSSKASYGMFDIFNIIFYPININYFVIYEIQILLKIIVAGISCYILLNYIYGKSKGTLLCSLCYGLSSFAVYFVSQPGFLSFYALLPLYLYGIETYIKDNKKCYFIISVFLLLVTNYYLFFSISLFSPFYFAYRYINNKHSFKGFVLSAFKLVLLYLIGFLISGCVIIPTFLYIIQNERVGNFNGSLVFKDIILYLHLIVNGLVPSQTYIYESNVFDFRTDLAHQCQSDLVIACLFDWIECRTVVVQAD